MTSLFKRLSDGAEHPDVATYKAIRTAGKSWCGKIMRHPTTRTFDMRAAAKKLTLTVEGTTLIFEDEVEEAVFLDYLLFDYWPKGKSLAESCSFSPGELTPLESEIHRAKLASRTSLFEVAEVHASEPKILLHDRLNPEAPALWLTDLGLSATFRGINRKVFLFTRAVALHGIHLTSGFSFAFEEKHGATLIDEYRRAMWSIAAPLRDRRRTGWFLHYNRRWGLPQAGADVAPPSTPKLTA